ncbi:hypothetical protein N7533_001806 [Penicillium manginii]|uniref:uncharacterized protein n=1 Tax=Penicillium manginii TaxID=203109 RepID=UPI002548B617|nr:uncharacterized protein N7533_001806 [Penicillium manginii]KAJ5763125.1 hypothetical protein N7533_001806 [Penicillium manginii]
MAELGLAVFATIPICYKQGKTLVRLCQQLQGAQSKVAEIALDIERHWIQTRIQIEFLENVKDSLDEDLRDIQNRTLFVLIEKLSAANTKLDKVFTRTADDGAKRQTLKVSKWRYILYREGLEEVLEDLKSWQDKLFNPSWFLTMRIQSPQIDIELSNSLKLSEADRRQQNLPNAQSLRRRALRHNNSDQKVFLDSRGLDSAQILDVPFSSAKFAKRPESSQLFVVDTISVNNWVDTRKLVNDIREFASGLSDADPAMFGMLNCFGVIPKPNHTQPTSFSFVFTAPKDSSEGTSLRSRLISNRLDHSLSDRFRIAQELVRSVFYVHVHGFVHKNIRPETILLLSNGQADFGSVFLVGFDSFRRADGDTVRLGDSFLEKNLYRHPQRLGSVPEDRYIMQHDIYSLGVCLLELGLWDTFVTYNDESNIPHLSSILKVDTDHVEAARLKDHLVSLADEVLPRHMGTKYARIVKTCLTCLDEENADFGDEREHQDKSGILVAVRYIEKILFQLNEINL